MSLELPFELVSEAYGGTLRPLELVVHDEVNRPYQIEARLSVPRADAVAAAEGLFESRATVLLPTPNGPRKFHGLIADTQLLREDAFGDVAVELLLVPHLEQLRHKQQARIFQHKTTSAILSTVVGEVGQRVELRIARELGERVYCCQYHESDFSFFERLVAEDGLFYWFEHDGDEETLVLADGVHAYRPIAGKPDLRYREAGTNDAMLLEEHHVTALTGRRSLRTKGTVRRDFDLLRPRLGLAARHGLAGLVGAPVPSIERETLRRTLAHDVHGGSREQARVLGEPPDRYTEALRTTSTLYSGASVCRRLAVGRSFRLQGDARGLAEEMVALGVTLRARTTALAEDGTTYEATFQAVPADVPMRPPPRSLKPAAVSETAIVVGPVNEEIHTDELGRVKVQFHWDRDGAQDDHSSCWLRVQHAWSGAGFGAQFLPRVGTEVLVGFIAGDPDRPVVTGSLFNAACPFPFAVPENKAKMGFRTRSTGPGEGGGAHEIVFDDTRGSETMSLRSQGEMAITAFRSAALQVGGDHRTTVQGLTDHSVGGDASLRVGGNCRSDIAHDLALRAEGNTQLNLFGTLDIDVAGKTAERYAKDVTTIVGGSRATFVGHGTKEPAVESTSVQGSLRTSATLDTSVLAGHAIELRCGESSILLLPKKILITSPEIDIRGHDRIGARQGRNVEATWTLQDGFTTGGGNVVLASSDGATLVLDADAHLDGGFVKLNCGSDKTPAGPRVETTSEKGTLTFEVLRDGIPPSVTEVTLVLLGPDGKRVEKMCAVGGSVTVEGRPGDTYALAEMRAGDQVLVANRVDSKKGA